MAHAFAEAADFGAALRSKTIAREPSIVRATQDQRVRMIVRAFRVLTTQGLAVAMVAKILTAGATLLPAPS